ncbi:MAG: hypothetical protein RLZZ366_791 [Pseudomonadota bacterium]|jgi:TetR/AcrR family transcriptional regulator, tetracycline repressor protein
MASQTERKRGHNRLAVRGPEVGAGSLTQEIVVAAALVQIDTEGFEAFSIRALAARLNVYPAALYWYVANRNELLARVVALVLADTVPPRRRRLWQTHLRDIFDRFRKAVQAHPNIAPLIGTQLVSNASVSFDLVEDLLATLVRAGLSGAKLIGAYNTLLAGLVGFSTQEFAPLPTENLRDWQLTVQTRLLSLDSEAFPTLAANLSLLSNHAFILRWQSGAEAPLDDSYEVYVEVIIAGLEALVARQ